MKRLFSVILFLIAVVVCLSCNGSVSINKPSENNTELLTLKLKIITIQEMVEKEEISSDQGNRAIQRILEPSRATISAVVSTSGQLAEKQDNSWVIIAAILGNVAMIFIVFKYF